MAQKAQKQDNPVTPFVYDKATQLLTQGVQRQKNSGPQPQIEDRLVLANSKLGPLVCYVSKIDVKNNFVELCDTKYSIKCKFETAPALTTLKDYVKS